MAAHVLLCRERGWQGRPQRRREIWNARRRHTEGRRQRPRRIRRRQLQGQQRERGWRLPRRWWPRAWSLLITLCSLIAAVLCFCLKACQHPCHELPPSDIGDYRLIYPVVIRFANALNADVALMLTFSVGFSIVEYEDLRRLCMPLPQCPAGLC
jgi:hypothetical protein